MKAPAPAALLCLALLLAPLPARAGLGIGIGSLDFKKTLYVLTVGINEYKDANYKLKYSVADSRDFAATIERGGRNAFDSVKVVTLTDAQATRDAVGQVFDRIIREATPADTFIFHFAGTGKAIPEEKGGEPVFYLATSDITTFSDDRAELRAKGISGRMLAAWSSKIQARQQLFLLDSCDSGAALDNLSTSIVGESRIVRDLTGRNIVVMGMDAMTFERAELGHGEFSYALIEGLKGEADLSGDGRITARELQAHMHGKLPKLRIEAKAEIVSPRIQASGEDFTVAALKKLAPPKYVRRQSAAQRPDNILGPPERLNTSPERSVTDDGSNAAPTTPRPQTPPTRDTTNAAAPAPAPAAPARRVGKDYALLFATDEYDDAGYLDLDNPVRDAREIAKELKENYGFQTRVVENPTLDDIYTVLREYAERDYGDEDQLFIFFAGHGTFDERVGQGYIVARDSRKDDVNKKGYLSHPNLNSIVDNIKSPHTLLLLDVCFGAKFNDMVVRSYARKSREDTGYSDKFSGVELFKKKAGFTTRKFLASGAEPVSDGVAGQGSPFARAMLEALRRWPKSGYLTFGDIKKAVENVKPGPIDADFGFAAAGSDFFFFLGRS